MLSMLFPKKKVPLATLHVSKAIHAHVRLIAIAKHTTVSNMAEELLRQAIARNKHVVADAAAQMERDA